MKKKSIQERIKEIAKKPSAIRYEDKHFKAIKRGNFYDYFGIDAEFYVLNDNDQTVVVTASGLDKIISLGKNSSKLYELLSVQYFRKFIESNLIEKLENPIIFQCKYSNGISDIFSFERGFNITIIKNICTAILAARSDGVIVFTKKTKKIK
ncbi:hypothetical protein QE177_04720 [Arsenophonus sp. aPb]|uniref:hypothetical protein n=1 Tax=Arsenophonus sp. aPb TaxID=3041619 RepID=UPI0024689825|nr:hypothetical protein [Arsenophonus sp. aPb]WGL99189.1 hypothetical protein QE177_04720 [Arsenophonus sp. aPb]